MSRKLMLAVLILTGDLVVGYFVGARFRASPPLEDGAASVAPVNDSELATTSVTEIEPRPTARPQTQ